MELEECDKELMASAGPSNSLLLNPIEHLGVALSHVCLNAGVLLPLGGVLGMCLGGACQTCIRMKARKRLPSRTVHCNEIASKTNCGPGLTLMV